MKLATLLDSIRAYYRFKADFNFSQALLPWKRKALKKHLKSNKVDELIRIKGDFLVPVSSHDDHLRHLQLKGSIDAGMEWVINRYVRPGSTAIDIGTNLGFLSLLMAEKAGKVISFEPNLKLHPYIHRLFKVNRLNNYDLHNKACSNENGTIRFSVDKDDHSQSKISDEGIEVNMVKLDDLLAEEKDISFLKIDVEGHEPAVFEGAINILKNRRPVLVFETGTHKQDELQRIKAILENVDYEVLGKIKEWGVTPCDLDVNVAGNKSFCNILAIPN